MIAVRRLQAMPVSIDGSVVECGNSSSNYFVHMRDTSRGELVRLELADIRMNNQRQLTTTLPSLPYTSPSSGMPYIGVLLATQ